MHDEYDDDEYVDPETFVHDDDQSLIIAQRNVFSAMVVMQDVDPLDVEAVKTARNELRTAREELIKAQAEFDRLAAEDQADQEE